jgi:sulfatase maturation enzyme AslB (radical SAM superfamily)
MTHAEIAPVAPEVALRRPAALQATPRPFAFVLVKLASRCNINCTYCYWFRDAQVYEKPAVLTLEAERRVLPSSRGAHSRIQSAGFPAGFSWRRAAAVSEAQV